MSEKYIDTTCAGCGIWLRLGVNAHHPPAGANELFYCEGCGGHSETRAPTTPESILEAVAAMPQEQRERLREALLASFAAPLYPFQQGALDSMHLALGALQRAIRSYESLPRDGGGVSAQSGDLYDALDALGDARDEVQAAIDIATSQTV